VLVVALPSKKDENEAGLRPCVHACDSVASKPLAISKDCSRQILGFAGLWQPPRRVFRDVVFKFS
jgi:hypothetical protein